MSVGMERLKYGQVWRTRRNIRFIDEELEDDNLSPIWRVRPIGV